jgi:hypothetical protein
VLENGLDGEATDRVTLSAFDDYFGNKIPDAYRWVEVSPGGGEFAELARFWRDACRLEAGATGIL